MSGDTTPETRAATDPRPIVADFKTGDESEFQKPDHDPHGETCAAAAHSSTTCDNPACDERGVVPTALLDEASDFTRGPERPVVCSEACASTV